MMDLQKTVFALCGMMTVSGNEMRSIEPLRALVGDAFDRIETDAVGNILLTRLCGKENAPMLLIDTHFDEIGMMVSDICEGGFLRVVPIGGLDPSILQAADVTVYGKQTLRAVIASTPPHLQKAEDKKTLKKVDELLIDTGYPKEELEQLCPIGTPVGFSPRYTELLEGNLCGKSFDNKACAAAAICAVSTISRQRMAANVCLLLSCHEETLHTGGVAVAAFAKSPDYAMVIDVNLARVPDTPETETVPYRGGISISHSAVTDKRLTRAVCALCRKEGIPHYEVAAPSSTGTNAPALNLAGRGVPVVDIGLPLKNMHTYNEMLNMEDLEALTELVRAFVCASDMGEVTRV